jgi:regulator of sigma E protease
MHEIAFVPTLAFALPTLDGLGKIAMFLIMLSVLVVLHEYGHFLMARRAGVRVNDFAVGFGPTLLKWTSPRSGTNYRVNLLPIGGYCAMQGEDGKTSEAEQQRQFREAREQIGPGTQTIALEGGSVAVLSRPKTVEEPALFTPPAERAPLPSTASNDNFQSKSALARLSIVVAGPVANFILAYVILLVAAVTVGIGGDKVSTQIVSVVPNSPAAHAGLKVGDAIVSINGRPVDDGSAMVEKIHASIGKLLHIVIRRDGSTTAFDVTPQPKVIGGKTVGIIGFTPLPQFSRVAPAEAFGVAGLTFRSMVMQQVGSYAELFSHFRENAGHLSGVIGMGAEAGQVQDLGWGPYLLMAAMISIALGILNLLPFPALDGGRAVFIIAEMLRGKPVEPEKEALVHITGFAVLMVLMVVIAYHDVANLISGKGVL